MATATKSNGQARGFRLAAWQKQWRAIEKAASIARKNPKFFNPNLTK